MSFTAQGVYRALLDLQWEDGFLISYDDAAAILRLTPEEKSAFQPFYDLCFPDGINPKIDEQRQASLTYIERQRQVAKNKPKAMSRVANSKPKARSRVANTEPTASVSPTETETETTTETETMLTVDKSTVETTHVWSIPDGLQTEKFMHSWSAFVQHRKQMRKPISAVGGKALLRKLEQHTVEVATAALDESLSNGWQGVFPEKVDIERPGRVLDRLDPIRQITSKRTAQIEHVVNPDRTINALQCECHVLNHTLPPDLVMTCHAPAFSWHVCIQVVNRRRHGDGGRVRFSHDGPCPDFYAPSSSIFLARSISCCSPMMSISSPHVSCQMPGLTTSSVMWSQLAMMSAARPTVISETPRRRNHRPPGH